LSALGGVSSGAAGRRDASGVGLTAMKTSG
jgi:hypothetical protein